MTQRIKVQIEEEGKLRDATIPEYIAALLQETFIPIGEYCESKDGIHCADTCLLGNTKICYAHSPGCEKILYGKKVVFSMVEE